MSKALELSQLANDITYTEGTDTLSFGQANITIGSNALLSYNTFSGDLTVASNGAVTLATVNSNVGSFGSGSAIPVVTVNAKGLVTAVSTQSVNIVTTTDIAGDSGTDTITLGTDTLTFAGGTGLTSAVTNNNVSIALDNTAVSAGSYGGATAIPVITIDAQGRITSASTSSINTDLVSDTTPQLGGDLDTNGNNIQFTDGDRAIFGTDSDLSIRHSGSHSIIHDNGTGDLLIAGSQVRLMSSNVAENMITATTNGSVALYYDNNKKFETISTGVTITGTINSHTIPGGTGTLALTSNIPSDTDGLSEGSSNLYYTDARADARITNALGGNVTITGNLTVNGTTTTVNSNTVNIGDNIIVLNSDETGTPSQNGGIEIERGTSTNVSLRFNETTDKWQFTNDGTTYNDLGTSDIVNDTTPQLGGNLDINSNDITGTGNISITGDFILTSTDASSADDPTLDLYRNSASPANNDKLGHINFSGENDADEKIVYGEVEGQTTSVADGNEYGVVNISAMINGTFTQYYSAIYGENRFNRNIRLNTNLKLLFEGATNNNNETTLTVTDPTQDNTITFPDATGTVALTSDIDFTTSANHAFRQISDGSNQAVADSNIDTFTVTAGTDISAVVTPASDTLTITNTSTLDSVTTRGATTNTSILFPDNVKARFGDTSSPDMEIYHDGSNSYIDDTGTGSIFIRSGTTYIQNAAGTKTAFATNSGAEQTLYHNNSPKFATSATGVSVTGTVAATAYTGDGSALTGIEAAAGGGTDHAFLETDNTINSNYSISSNRNAMTVGPVTVASGATITVPSGQRWIIM